MTMGTYAKDLIERTLAVSAMSFLGQVLVEGFDLTSTEALRAAAITAVLAGLQVVYSALAFFVGNPKTAGLTDVTK